MDDKIARNLASNVKALREFNRLTQQELAEIADVSVSAIQHIEYGEGNKSRMITIKAIAAALKVSASQLMQEDYRSAPPSDRITKEQIELIKEQVKAELLAEMREAAKTQPQKPKLGLLHNDSFEDDPMEEVTPKQAKQLIIQRLNSVPAIFLPKLYYFFDELLILIASGKQLKNGQDPDSE